MAEKPATAGGVGAGGFKEFLKSIPTAAEAAKSAQLVGLVQRGEKEGSFTLTLQTGQPIELSADDVTRFTVVRQGPPPLVQVELPTEKIPLPLPPKVFKEIVKDAAQDPIGPGKQPLKDLLKDATKDPILDPIGTGPIDPIKLDTLEEGIGGGGIAGRDGGDPWASSGGAGGAGGMAPFAMMTPHHAPAAAIAMQNLGAAGQAPAAAAGPIRTLAIGEGPWTIKETWKDAMADGKHLVTDPLVDWPPRTYPGFDMPGTGIVDTLVEGIGPGGGGPVVNPGIWNLPGHLF